MKTLDQLEARTPVDASHTSGDADAEAIISRGGSYYLTGNLDVTKSEGIRVTAPGVTLDLNGFEVRRAPGSTGGAGIKILVGADRCTVKNGSISGLDYGLVAAADDSFAQAEGGSILNVRASGCLFGLSVGNRWHIAGCTVQGNTGAGISAANGAIVENCSASRNGSGIVASGVISRCTASANSAYGFDLSNGATIDYCSATDNTLDGIHATSRVTVSNCVATGNQQHGIVLGDGSSVSNCTASFNKNDGIRSDGNALVLNNNCSSNGNGAPIGAGIHAFGSANRIEGNNTSSNDTGIQVDAGGNIIIKNSSRGGTKAFDIAAGNSEGQEINVFSPTTTTTINTTNAWANFLY